jgi:hypothetical protein
MFKYDSSKDWNSTNMQNNNQWYNITYHQTQHVGISKDHNAI